MEHILLFNLFGDPLMRMYYPQPLQIDVPTKAMAGTHLEVRGNSPITGQCTVELVCRRDRLRDEPPTRHRYDGSARAQAAFNIVYLQANDRRWTERRVDVERGPFLTAIKIPKEARGACHVCVLVEDETGRQFALGSQDIQIAAPQSDALPVQASLQDDGEHPGTQGRVSDVPPLIRQRTDPCQLRDARSFRDESSAP